MGDEHEQIKAVEETSFERVTSEICSNNNTSGYVGDSSENDVIIGTEDSELVAPQRFNSDNLSNQPSGLTAEGSTSGKCDDITNENISKPATSESNILDDFRNRFSAGGSQAVNHETVSMLEQLPANKTSDSAGSLKLPSPPKYSPANNEEHEPASAAEMDAIDPRSSQSSRGSFNYLMDLASFDLPLQPLYDDEEKIVWPLKEEFSLKDQCKFEEGTDYWTSIEIGTGAFGKCYSATVKRVNTEEERVFCVKKCEYRVNELLVLSLARKNKVAEIVEFYGATIKGKNVSLFMEYMTGGTIKDLIMEREKMLRPIIPEKDILSYLQDVLKALKFLHENLIVHRDIKGENVLLDEHLLNAKLTDFGSAERTQKGVTSAVDTWKTGGLLLEMWNGERAPLLIDEGTLPLQRQNSCDPEKFFPSQAMKETKQLLRLLFGLDGGIPSAAEVLRHSEAFPVTELLKRFTRQSQNSESTT